MTQLATRDHFTTAQNISIALFAVVLPLFADSAFVLRSSGHRAREKHRRAQRIGLTGGYLFVLGIGSLCWSLSSFSGLLFFVVIVGLVILRIQSNEKLIKRGSLLRSLAKQRKRRSARKSLTPGKSGTSDYRTSTVKEIERGKESGADRQRAEPIQAH